MSKYEKLDQMILSKIGEHPQMFSDIYRTAISKECDRIAVDSGMRLDESFRVLDRRLQALRKAGKIFSTTKGWIKTTWSAQ